MLKKMGWGVIGLALIVGCAKKNDNGWTSERIEQVEGSCVKELKDESLCSCWIKELQTRVTFEEWKNYEAGDKVSKKIDEAFGVCDK